MSLLLRSSARIARQQRSAVLQQARGVHFENVVGDNFPFSYKSKPFTGIKVASYFTVGFGLPFFAAWWHIHKAAGAAA